MDAPLRPIQKQRHHPPWLCGQGTTALPDSNGHRPDEQQKKCTQNPEVLTFCTPKNSGVFGKSGISIRLYV